MSAEFAECTTPWPGWPGPGVHSRQERAATPLVFPAAQTPHATEPVATVYLPVGQSAQLLVPYLPAGHGSAPQAQTLQLALALSLPSALKHAVQLPPLRNLPAAQHVAPHLAAMPAGRSQAKKFPLRAQLWRSRSHTAVASAMTPEISLLYRSKRVTFVMVDHVDGRGPEISLSCSCMLVTLVMFDHDGGRGPEILLFHSCMLVIFVMVDHDGGRGPEISLLDRSMYLTFVMVDHVDGRGPEILL